MEPSMFEKFSPTFPPVIGVDGLSVLLGKAPASILADRCRAPHRLPRACTPPGCKSPRWITADVLAWLAAFREPAVLVEKPVAVLRRPGRPRKAEQVAARVNKARYE